MRDGDVLCIIDTTLLVLKFLWAARVRVLPETVVFVAVGLDALNWFSDLLVLRANVYILLLIGLCVGVCRTAGFVIFCLSNILLSCVWCFVVGVFVRVFCNLALVFDGLAFVLSVDLLLFIGPPFVGCFICGVFLLCFV